MGEKKYYWICVAGIVYKANSNEALEVIETVGFWSRDYPTRKQIFEEAKTQAGVHNITLVMSITAMTEHEFDRFMEV